MQKEIKLLLEEIFLEFRALSIPIDVDPRSNKESYNLQKKPSGEWYKISKASLHELPVLSELNLNLMPSLKELTDMIDEIDEEIKTKGGRIFIAEDHVFKIKRGTETNLLFDKNNSKVASGKYSKLCTEISSFGAGPDRYRIQETYLLVKSASGEWSINTTDDNHSGYKTVLDLRAMPELKVISAKLNKIDPQFGKNGGRIFITATRIYRLKNKVEVDYKI